MKRYLESLIEKTPQSKIILLSGPRQVGKTTCVRNLFPDSIYLNWDNLDHRSTILGRSWSREQPCVIFDELHKMPRWKGWLKGIYDVEGHQQRYIVTGSAQLNTFKKVGDSLAGRFFGFTLHPVDLSEASHHFSSEVSGSLQQRLLNVGGFPEPFLLGEESFYKMWRKSHLDIVLRQDLIDLQSVQQIAKIEMLIEHLRVSVGSPISFKAISEDLQVSDHTVKSWVQLLESLYIIFRIVPFTKNIKRAVLKSPKIYFFDIPLANRGGARFENLIACALKKQIDYRNESGHGEYELRYLRNRDSKEIDFLILHEKKPLMMIEAKTSDTAPAKHFKSFGNSMPGVAAVQLIQADTEDRDYPFGVSIRNASNWLAKIGERF